MADEVENPNFSQEQWTEMKSRYNKAKDLLQKVADLHIKFETAQVNLKSTQTEIEKVSTEAKEKFTTIENAKNDSTTFVTEIKGHLEKVQSSIVLLNESLAKFEGIKGKIEGKDGEIENLVSTANSLKADIEKTKADALQRLNDISGLFTQVQEKITEMQNAYETFIGIREKILDGKTGLEAILNQAQNLNTQSQKVFTEITDYRDKSKTYLEEIEKNKNSSDIFTNEIGENLSKSKDKLSEVEKITGLIADTGLANSFQKREKMLRWSSGIWLGILVLAVGGLATFLYFLFKNYFNGATTIPEIPVLILRITLTSPLLFIIGIATHNYGKERDLNEKYAFKATIAEVMRSHADFLVETSQKTNEENTMFIRDTIKSLYSEPFETALDMKKVNKELRNILDKDTDKKFKVTDIVNKVKELKELVPDEVLLKNIVDILIKFK
jgi:uncharacterized coiled-coil DUF342 family protein